MSIIDVLENNRVYVNQNPKCEPQLGKRGLYRKMGGQAQAEDNELAMLWVLNFSDGDHSLCSTLPKSQACSFRLSARRPTLCATPFAES